MAGKEIAVKKYVARLSAAERGGARDADGLYRLGQALGAIADESAHLLKADVSNAGEG